MRLINGRARPSRRDLLVALCQLKDIGAQALRFADDMPEIYEARQIFIAACRHDGYSFAEIAGTLYADVGAVIAIWNDWAALQREVAIWRAADVLSVLVRARDLAEITDSETDGWAIDDIGAREVPA